VVMYNDMLNLIEIIQLIYFVFYIMIKDFQLLINLMKIYYLIQNILHNDDLKRKQIIFEKFCQEKKTNLNQLMYIFVHLVYLFVVQLVLKISLNQFDYLINYKLVHLLNIFHY